MANAGERKKEAEYGASADKAKEVPVIPTADTVVQPNTVMVQSLDAVVAYSAVIASWWPPDIATFAVLDRNIHGCCLRSCQSDHDPVVSRRTHSQRVVRVSRRKRMNISRENLYMLASLRLTDKIVLTPGSTSEAWIKEERQR